MSCRQNNWHYWGIFTKLLLQPCSQFRFCIHRALCSVLYCVATFVSREISSHRLHEVPESCLALSNPGIGIVRSRGVNQIKNYSFVSTEEGRRRQEGVQGSILHFFLRSHCVLRHTRILLLQDQLCLVRWYDCLQRTIESKFRTTICNHCTIKRAQNVEYFGLATISRPFFPICFHLHNSCKHQD